MSNVQLTLWPLMVLCGIIYNEWTHCGLVMPYDVIILGQHWFCWWLVVWWHQAIIWTNVEFSSTMCYGNHSRVLLLEIWKTRVTKFNLTILHFRYSCISQGPLLVHWGCHSFAPSHWHLNPLRAKFFRGNINIYLHFMALLNIDMTQVLKILPQVRPGPTYST